MTSQLVLAPRTWEGQYYVCEWEFEIYKKDLRIFAYTCQEDE